MKNFIVIFLSLLKFYERKFVHPNLFSQQFQDYEHS